MQKPHFLLTIQVKSGIILRLTGCGEVWYRAWFGTKRPRVQIPTLRPRRRKLCIACDDFFMRCIKKSSRAHAAAPPFQIEPTSLGFDLVNCDRKTQILSLHSDHVGAKSALLRRSFFSRSQKTSCACSRFFPNRTRAPEFKGTPPKNRPEENK